MFHEAIMDLMYSQIKLKMELIDPQVQSSKIQSMLRFWVRQLTLVINRTVRSILAGAAILVDLVNATSGDTLSSEQCDDQLVANSTAARNFIEEMKVVNQEPMQI